MVGPFLWLATDGSTNWHLISRSLHQEEEHTLLCGQIFKQAGGKY